MAAEESGRTGDQNGHPTSPPKKFTGCGNTMKFQPRKGVVAGLPMNRQGGNRRLVGHVRKLDSHLDPTLWSSSLEQPIECGGFGEFTMPFARSQGADIYYELRGTCGPPLVLLRGFASSIHTWNGVDFDLGKDHRTIVLDNRGIGRSTAPAG